jgi:hypothetical protein
METPMKRKEKRKNPIQDQQLQQLAESCIAHSVNEPSAEEKVAAGWRAYNALHYQSDPDLPWTIPLAEIRRRICAPVSRKGTYRHRLLTSVSTDTELLFLNRLYEMAKTEALHVCQWSGQNPDLDEPIWCAGNRLSKAETRAYNALMQMGYDPDDQRARVDLHTRLVVQMVFHLIGLYKKGK